MPSHGVTGGDGGICDSKIILPLTSRIVPSYGQQTTRNNPVNQFEKSRVTASQRNCARKWNGRYPWVPSHTNDKQHAFRKTLETILKQLQRLLKKPSNCFTYLNLIIRVRIQTISKLLFTNHEQMTSQTGMGADQRPRRN